MMHAKISGLIFRTAVLVLLGSLGFARTARASSNYPPALAQAIAVQYPNGPKCVPLCTACHLTTAGGPGNLNKFGISMVSAGHLQQSAPDPTTAVGDALKLLAMTDPDSDGDGTKDIEEIEAGDSPSLAYPDGVSQWCSDIKYGCGAHIAAAPAPPVDRIGLFSAGLVGLGVAMTRRRRGTARTRRAHK